MEVEVAPTGGGGWVVLSFGVERAYHRTKPPAVEQAEDLAERYGLSLTIRRQNGSMQRQKRYAKNNGW